MNTFTFPIKMEEGRQISFDFLAEVMHMISMDFDHTEIGDVIYNQVESIVHDGDLVKITFSYTDEQKPYVEEILEEIRKEGEISSTVVPVEYENCDEDPVLDKLIAFSRGE